MKTQRNTEDLNKIQEFKVAMDDYNNNVFYQKFGIFISTIIVFMQIISLCHVFKISDWNILSAVVLIGAYITTDFINGLIHMYMDNNTHYNSIMGPFIAAFHMHHKQPTYKKRHPVLIYFFESGAKVWLAVYMLILLYVQYEMALSFNINLFFVSIGIFSSFAEVSHYWCHNADEKNMVIRELQNLKILLSKAHHTHHHIKDNTHYAFLNGVTNPFLNLIAKHFYSGYKNNADRHVLAYKGKNTANRAIF
jgi:hypothetical protein